MIGLKTWTSVKFDSYFDHLSGADGSKGGAAKSRVREVRPSHRHRSPHACTQKADRAGVSKGKAIYHKTVVRRLLRAHSKVTKMLLFTYCHLSSFAPHTMMMIMMNVSTFQGELYLCISIKMIRQWPFAIRRCSRSLASHVDVHTYIQCTACFNSLDLACLSRSLCIFVHLCICLQTYFYGIMDFSGGSPTIVILKVGLRQIVFLAWGSCSRLFFLVCSFHLGKLPRNLVTCDRGGLYVSRTKYTGIVWLHAYWR